MDSPQQSKNDNLNQESKRNQNQSSTPPQKDAYARLLSQHRSSKFTLYLEEYAKYLSCQQEENGFNPVLQAHSNRLNVVQHKREQMVFEFSDSSDFSPSSLKSKGEESSLSLYMEKLSACGAQQEWERKQGVSELQQRGQRRDTATSQDGDIESGEEIGPSKLSCAKKNQKQQRKKEVSNRTFASKEAESLFGVSQSQMKASTKAQEQEKMEKSKNEAENPEEGKFKLRYGADPQSSKPKPPHSKDKQCQPPTGQLQITVYTFPFVRQNNLFF